MIVPISTKTTPDSVSKFDNTGGQLFITIVGQSNAAGNETTSNPPDGIAIDDIIPNSYIFDIVARDWQQLVFGVNQKQAQNNLGNATSYGIEPMLMTSLSNYNSQVNYLLKATYSGSQLYNNNTLCWNVFCTPVFSGGIYLSLWLGMLNFIYTSTFKNPVRNLNTGWVVYMQGENDANGGSTLYNAFQTNLTDFINYTRAHTGYGTNLKFILVSLSSNQTGLDSTGLAAVNTAMSNISGSLTNVFYIAQNSSVKVDNIHYDKDGLTAIAALVYDVIINN